MKKLSIFLGGLTFTSIQSHGSLSSISILPLTLDSGSTTPRTAEASTVDYKPVFLFLEMGMYDSGLFNLFMAPTFFDLFLYDEAFVAFDRVL